MGASTARKASFTALTLILTPLAGWADNARDWQNTPTDLNMLFGYYNRVDSNTPSTPRYPSTVCPSMPTCISCVMPVASVSTGATVPSRSCSLTPIYPHHSTTPAISPVPNTTVAWVTPNWCSHTTSLAAPP